MAPRAFDMQLRGYFDDSGDPADPQHSCITIAGYVTTIAGWSWFERHWSHVMSQHGVPYLHMKELGKRDGVYHHLKANKNSEADFLTDCIRAIQTATEFSTSATIVLEDLARFNTETGLQLNARALALYGCIIEMRRKYPNDQIDVKLDRIVKPSAIIGLAQQYASSDTYANLEVGHMRIAPLEEGLSFRNTPPMQAADFTAWEIRKSCEERKTWKPTETERADRGLMRQSFETWRNKFYAQNGRFPRDRMSARMLSAWPPPAGNLWDYHLIRAAHINRHANGWGH